MLLYPHSSQTTVPVPRGSPAPPRTRRSQPRHIPPTSASSPRSVPSQSSPLVTAPILTADSAQSGAILSENNDPPMQTDSLETPTDTQVPRDTASRTPVTSANTITPRSRGNAEDEDDDTTANPVPANNLNDAGRVPDNSIASGPSNASPAGKNARGKKPKKFSGKYVVHTYSHLIYSADGCVPQGYMLRRLEE